MITKRLFEVKERAFLINFKGLSVSKNFLRPGSVPLKPIINAYAIIHLPSAIMRNQN